MSDWQLQIARTRLGELIDDAQSHGPQTITRRGKAAVVVLSVDDYRKNQAGTRTLSQFFARSPLRGLELNVTRGHESRRGTAAL